MFFRFDHSINAWSPKDAQCHFRGNIETVYMVSNLIFTFPKAIIWNLVANGVMDETLFLGKPGFFLQNSVF